MATNKNQCSKDYFYGKDEQLENAIQLIETGYSRALRELIQNSGTLTEGNKIVLKMFWLFQHLRTEAAATRAIQMSESIRALADLSSEEFTLGIKEAVLMACKTFVESMHEIDNLKFCIIKNNTKTPFITSDNPAILTNKWRLEKGRSPGHSFGMGSAGMMALLPLTPKLFFLGYDGDVYNVPKKSGVVHINNSRDVIALNRHQFLHCVANVYVNDESLEVSLIKQYSEIEFARPKAHHIAHFAQIDITEENYDRYVIIKPEDRDKTKKAMTHTLVIHPHPGIWPSQIQIRPNGSVYTNGTGMG